MIFLTNFADLGLLLPLAGLIALSLAAVGRRHDAVVWSLVTTGTFATMLLLKLLVLICIGPLVTHGLGNPSGHTAAGTVVYAGLATLLGERFVPRMRLAILSAIVFSLIFGLTRVGLGVHSVADVLVGGMVGLLGALTLAHWAGQRRSGAPGPALAVVGMVALFAVWAFHGHHIHAEAEIRSLAAQIESVSDL